MRSSGCVLRSRKACPAVSLRPRRDFQNAGVLHTTDSASDVPDACRSNAIAARTRAGEVVWILTTFDASQLPGIAVMGLYRLRWQIELLFKRLKSLLHLDTLPSREGPTAKSWMLARLIAAVLAQRLVQPSGPLSPWGYELRFNRHESTHA